MKVRFELKGTSPMLMHNIQLANPLNPIARQMKVVTAKRKKTDEDFESLSRLEFEGGLYHLPEVGPYVPGANIEKTMVEGGRISKQGKQIERGLFVIDNVVPLIYPGPRDIESLCDDLNFRDIQAVKVGTSRVMRTRPIFRQWELQVDADLDEGMLNFETMQQIAEDAGTKVGLGDYRPRYGRFSVSIDKL